VAPLLLKIGVGDRINKEIDGNAGLFKEKKYISDRKPPRKEKGKKKRTKTPSSVNGGREKKSR